MLSYTPPGLCQWHGRYRCKLRQLKCQGGGGGPAEELSTSWEGSFWREHPLNTLSRERIDRFVQLLFSSHQTNWERTKDKMRISMALVECVDPASKKLFLTRVWIGVIARTMALGLNEVVRLLHWGGIQSCQKLLFSGNMQNHFFQCIAIVLWVLKGSFS